MSPETGLIGFAALTCLTLAMPKHRLGIPVAAFPTARVTRGLGWILLVVSAIVAIAQDGWAFGVVAWIGQLGVAGACLVLLISWRPAYAPAAGALALACAPLLGL